MWPHSGPTSTGVQLSGLGQKPKIFSGSTLLRQNRTVDSGQLILKVSNRGHTWRKQNKDVLRKDAGSSSQVSADMVDADTTHGIAENVLCLFSETLLLLNLLNFF